MSDNDIVAIMTSCIAICTIIFNLVQIRKYREKCRRLTTVTKSYLLALKYYNHKIEENEKSIG